MVRKKEDKELFFLQSRRTIEEIAGWKMLIFLPQTTLWRFLMIAVVIIVFMYNFARALYLKDPYLYAYVVLGGNLMFCIDFVLSALHYFMKETRKLRHGKRRPVYLLIIDLISLIPLEEFYENYVHNNADKDQRLSYLLSLVVILRLYQIPMNFSFIKDSIFKVKIYLLVTVFQILSYFVIISYAMSCFIVLLFDEQRTDVCLNHYAHCVILNFMTTFYHMGLNYNLPFLGYDVSEYPGLLTINFFLGYMFTYGFVTPMVVFIGMKFLVKYFEYSKKLKYVKVLCDQLIKNKKFKKKVLIYFHELWKFGRFDKQPIVLDSFPLCFRKNIFCDMHWEAMRHSYLLGDISIGCKRSIALCMKTEFLLPKTKIFEKNKSSTHYLYLESGLLQVMAEENSRTPVLSLSGGTTLGELSFFLHTKCTATVRAAKFSVIHTLSLRDFFKVLTDYPADKKLILRKVKDRLKLGKSVHEIKTNICSHFGADFDKANSDEGTKWGNIKWIKNQYRAISQLKVAQRLLELQMYTFDDYERQIMKLGTQMKHTSVYLPFICVNDEKHRQGVVCLKKFPWLMDPQCQFIFVWEVIIGISLILTVTIYPCFIAFSTHIPRWFFCLSCIITLIYITDISLLFSTAVKIKNVTYKKFSVVFVHRISSMTLYLDLIAAIPLQVFAYNNNEGSNMYFLNSLVKCYRLIPVFFKFNYNPGPMVFIRTLTKFMLFLYAYIYLTASLNYVTFIECTFDTCIGFEEEHNVSLSDDDPFPMYISILNAVIEGFAMHIQHNVVMAIQRYVYCWILFFFFHCFSFTMKGECSASYVLEMAPDLEYKNQMDFVYDYIGSSKIMGTVRNRVMSAMQFQWLYDKKNFIVGKNEMWDGLPENLRKKYYRKCVLPVLAKSKLFESEEEHFLISLCRRAYHLALPENSLLLNLGTQTSRLYILRRGFVQINSFIAGDLYFNAAAPIIAKEGDIFPVIDVFTQTPSSIHAVTVSECEFLVLELEDVLSEMMIHNIFEDYFETIRSTNLAVLGTAKLGVSGYKKYPLEGIHAFEKFFKNMKWLRILFMFFLGTKSINSHSILYLYWEVIRLSLNIICLYAWPIALCCCYGLESQAVAVEILGLTELFFVLDFYIRLRIAYYNKHGVYVSHTFSTAKHYLMTTFLTDLLAYSPNFQIWYKFIKNDNVFYWKIIAVHMGLRSLSLYRFVGYVNYLRDYAKIIHRSSFTIGIFFLTLSVHYYLCFKVYAYLNGVMTPDFRLTHNDTAEIDLAYEYYLYEFSIILVLAVRSTYIVAHYSSGTVIFILLTASLGLICHIWLFSHLTLVSTSTNKSLTTYQYNMQSLLKFLMEQKADEHILDQAVEHFEHDWMHRKGYDVYQIFKSLPEILHEDVMYPRYLKTFSGVVSLSTANRHFYRTLSRHVQEVFLKEGSIIIFRDEVQTNIYFIHLGQCSPEDSKQVLFKGAMIGDINRTGIMKNTIKAKTHVKLLRLSSKIFFNTLENFYNTKRAFQSEASHAEDYIVSHYVEEVEEEFLVFGRKEEEVECEFVRYADEVSSTRKRKKKNKYYLNHNSKAAQFLRFLFMLVAYLTVIIIPFFIASRFFTPVILVIIYVLDFLWVIKITVSPRIIDPEKEASSKKRKLKRIFKVGCRIVFDIFTVLPVEVIPLLHYGLPLTNECCSIMCFCYLNRMLRVVFIFFYFKRKGKKLLVNYFMNICRIIMLKIAMLNIYCSVHVILTMQGDFQYLSCYYKLTAEQVNDLVNSYLCVIVTFLLYSQLNIFIGTGIHICPPDNIFQAVIQLLMAIIAIPPKAFFINDVLMIIYVTHHNKSKQMEQLEELENYLVIRDVSPILRSGAEKYYCNLLNTFYEGADSSFLTSAPSCIRSAIMTNIYVTHLKSSFLFRDVDDNFLQQLATRLFINVYFPGDYITEKGDVDHNIYFIEEGEVYCIEPDNHYKALENATDLYVTGETFGIQQGVFQCYPHTLTYRAKTLTKILILNFYMWEDLRLAFPNVFNSIYELCLRNV